MVEKITTVKNSVIAVSVKCSWSTPSAIDEAAGGRKRNRRERAGDRSSPPNLKYHRDSGLRPITLVAPAPCSARCEPAEKSQSPITSTVNTPAALMIREISTLYFPVAGS